MIKGDSYIKFSTSPLSCIYLKDMLIKGDIPLYLIYNNDTVKLCDISLCLDNISLLLSIYKNTLFTIFKDGTTYNVTNIYEYMEIM